MKNVAPTKVAVRLYLKKVLGAIVKRGQLSVHNTRSEAIISNPALTSAKLRSLFGKPVEKKHSLEFNVRGKGKIVLAHVGKVDVLKLISMH